MAFNARPDLPFDAEIIEGPEDGRVITVIGRPRSDDAVFSINLKTRSGTDLGHCDVGLHVAVRLNKHEVVLNSLIQEEWQKEQKAKCPELENDDFKLVICIRDGHYEVSMNGKELGTLEHKVPRENCKYILVNGPIDVHSIRFSGPGIRKTSQDEDAEDLAKDLKKMHMKQKDKKDKKKNKDDSGDEDDDDGEKKKKKKKDKKDKDDESGDEDDDGEKKKKKKKDKKDKDDESGDEEDDDGEKKKKKKKDKKDKDDESGDEDDDGEKKKKKKKDKKDKDGDDSGDDE